MVKELYQRTIYETSLKIIHGNIDAIIKKKITKSGCRVYADGYMGIAGTLGQPTEETWQKAEANLKDKIPYPFEPEKDKKRVRDLRNPDLSVELFLKEMESLLEIIKKEYPDFIFSNKIRLLESEELLKNDYGLEYVNMDRSLTLELVVKHVDSINIIDTYIIYESRDLNKDILLQEVRMILDANRRKAEFPVGKKVLIAILPNELAGCITNSLNGKNIGYGTSIFCDKLHTKVFHDNFHVLQGRGEEKYHIPFFDTEGCVNTEDQVFLIQNGEILKPYTDKKHSKMFELPLTGAAGGEYDELPSLDGIGLTMAAGEKTCKELFGNEMGILVVIASGGDYTGEGNYASPVQMAYLTDGEKLIGALPEFNLSGNLFGMFGEDFVGISKDKPALGNHLLVLRMNIDI